MDVKDPVRALREIHRVLRPGGFVQFCVPYVHMTLSERVNSLIEIEFALERPGEPSASSETAAAVPDAADTRAAPLFLHIRARKSEARLSS